MCTSHNHAAENSKKSLNKLLNFKLKKYIYITDFSNEITE